MIEGLILVAVVILSIQIWLYNRYKTVQYARQRYDRGHLLPRLHDKNIGDESYATFVLKGGCKLKCSINETAFIQVLEVSGAAAIRLRKGPDTLEDFFFASFEIRHVEGLHPFGQYIGAVWPCSAPSFTDERSEVAGKFYLSAPAFHFLLDACEARLGVERVDRVAECSSIAAEHRVFGNCGNNCRRQTTHATEV